MSECIAPSILGQVEARRRARKPDRNAASLFGACASLFRAEISLLFRNRENPYIHLFQNEKISNKAPENAPKNESSLLFSLLSPINREKRGIRTARCPSRQRPLTARHHSNSAPEETA